MSNQHTATPGLAIFERLAPLGYPLIRITAGLMLMPHGAQKLFGWFGGYGLEATGQFFEG
ncbi:MAG: DoxX family protein, partial [Pseudomonadota bacterium]|nr:DoxX family protein [Pseudomonadota bacterium]